MRNLAGVASAVILHFLLSNAASAQDAVPPGEACRQTGPVDALIDACTSALLSAGADVETYLSRRADGYWAKGNRALAVADYSAALRIRPSDAHVLGRLGEAKVDDRAFRAALPYLDESLRLDPTQASVYAARGKAHYELGEIERGLADLDIAVRVSREPDAGIIDARGDYYLDAGRLSAAIDDYNAIIAISDRYIAVYVDRARAYLLSRHPEKALADLDEAVSRWPETSSGALEARGRTRFLLGDLEGARADFEAALKIFPDRVYTALWLELVNREDRKPSRLLADAGSAPVGVWPGPMVSYLLGNRSEAEVRTAATAGDAESARGNLCEFEYYTGELARIAGDAARADALFRSAIKRCPVGFIERFGTMVRLLPAGALSAVKPEGGGLSTED